MELTIEAYDLEAHEIPLMVTAKAAKKKFRLKQSTVKNNGFQMQWCDFMCYISGESWEDSIALFEHKPHFKQKHYITKLHIIWIYMKGITSVSLTESQLF